MLHIPIDVKAAFKAETMNDKHYTRYLPRVWIVDVLTPFGIHTYKKENSNCGVMYLLISVECIDHFTVYTYTKIASCFLKYK